MSLTAKSILNTILEKIDSNPKTGNCDNSLFFFNVHLITVEGNYFSSVH